MIPQYQKFYNTIIDYLKDKKDHSIIDIYNYCIEKHNITEDEKKLTYDNSGANIVYSRISWGITYLKKASLIECIKKGVYRITEEGFKVQSNIVIDNNYLLKYPSFQEFKNISNDNGTTIDNNDNQSSPEDRINSSYNEFRDKLVDELLEKLLKLDPTHFEHLVNKLLSKMGYGEVENTSQSGDGGIDGIIYGDKLGFDRIYVQAKRWAADNKISSQDIDAFSGAMNKFASSSKGVYITTSSFSQPALDSINQNKNQQIIPIDGKKLAEYMIDYDMGVEKQQEYIIKRIDNDFFDNIQGNIE